MAFMNFADLDRKFLLVVPFFLAQLTGYVFLQAGIVPYSITRNNKALLSTPTKK